MALSAATAGDLADLAGWLGGDIVDDLPSFGALVQIKTKGQGKIPFGWSNWHPEQRRFERERTGRDIILKPRQIGFSTMELARDLLFARTHEGAQVVVVVHTGDAKTELFAAVHLMARCLAELGLLPRARENTKTGLRWSDTDSSIKVIEAGKDETTAADRGRSGTIHRLHVTEAAFYRAPEETMTALLEASGNNECVIESTANGVGNWFHQKVEAARHGRFMDFRFHFFPWFHHPHYVADPALYTAPPATAREQKWEMELRRLGCTPEQVAWWRMKVEGSDLSKMLREYPPTPDAAFQASGERWLDPEHIDRLRGGVRDPRSYWTIGGRAEWGALRVYEPPQQGEGYILACDPSEGVGRNEAAIVVIHHRTGRICAAWDNDKVKPGELGHVVAHVGRFYNTALAAVERNKWRSAAEGGSEGGRETIAVLMRDERYPERRVYHHRDKSPGWATTSETRPLIWHDLAKAIESRDAPVECPDARIVSEAASIVVDENGRPRAPGKRDENGSDDGLFVCWGIARQVREQVPPPSPVVARPVGHALDSSRFRT